MVFYRLNPQEYIFTNVFLRDEKEFFTINKHKIKMERYSLVDPNRPYTQNQIREYCTKFYKGKWSKTFKLTLEKHPMLAVEGLLRGRPTILYMRIIFLAMECVDPNFRIAHKKYKKQKEREAGEPGRKLLRIIFGS